MESDIVTWLVFGFHRIYSGASRERIEGAMQEGNNSREDETNGFFKIVVPVQCSPMPFSPPAS